MVTAIRGNTFSFLLLVVCLYFPGSHLHAQQNGVFFTGFPYDGNNAPADRSKIVFGSTPEEVCAQLTEAEIIGAQTAPIVFVGTLPGGTCGYQYLAIFFDGTSAVITNGDFNADFAPCGTVFAPPAPQPPICFLPCPADQVGPDGFCRDTSPKNGGPPCPGCGNPVNPGTGNKFQAESDLAARGPGSLSLVRYYNSGRPAYSRALGGYWQHTYTSRILINGDVNQATYDRNDGKQLVFNLQSGVWTGDADVADALTELKDSNLRRTGWKLRLASTDDTEGYDASGRLISIQTRTGLTQSLTYTDGTDGATSGNGGFVLDAAGNPTAAVLPKGILLRVADNFGRTLTFGYDALNRIVKVTDPAGGAISYGYSAQASLVNLTSVTYPDGRQRQYQYNEAAQTGGANLPYALTGITDENGARFATFSYDSFGRATQTVHDAGGSNADRYQLTYNVSGAQTTVTDPLGTVRTHGFQTTVGVVKNTAQTQPAGLGTGSATNATTYDANGNIASRTDFNGNLTSYSYDLTRNLETSRSEAFGTAQARTIATQWHPVFRLPARVAEPLRTTSYVYNGDGGASCGLQADGTTLVPGALCSKTIQPTTDTTGTAGFGATAAGTPRTWSYTYNANGSVLTMDGPRTDVGDVTTYTYYANDNADPGKRGSVATITNALGHVTSIAAYNAHGQPLTIVDPNGLITDLTYDERQRLRSRNVGGELTIYTYDAVGQLTQVSLPDNSSLTYSYDAAHRLSGMHDNLGNRIAYTLDAMGNRTREEVFDPANALAQTRSRVFNNLNRLFQEIGAQNQTTQYAYDNQGNLTSIDGPLPGTVDVTSNAYDALNRLIRVTDPNQGQTQYAYNGIDQLVSVTDPRNLATTYNYDGLANLNQQVSPDTGTTANTYDAAGNLLTQTDAKGQVTTYTYDALNRVTSITFHDGSKQTYAYDQGANGIGRLSSITETNPQNQVTSLLAYAYDQKGRTTSETRTINGVAYALAYSYDAAGRMNDMTYPSGRTIAYTFDALGRIGQVSTTPQGGAAQIVASNIAYQPFGGVKSYTLGNGQSYTRSYDTDGRIASYSLGAQSFALNYDEASRIRMISETGNAANMNTYDYDNLDRLTSAVLPNLPFAYGYDAVGNRSSKTVGSATDTYAYGATSNRLASITAQAGATRSFAFDADGSTTNDGINQYLYDARGRLTQSVGALGTTTYQVNALGQRIRKTNSTDDRVFLYDTRGHLIAETDPGGGLKREYLYLNDIPLVVFQ
jgi:YD repeat-containing protein